MIINRGGEQGAQHAQSLQSMFVHCPGLNVVYPSSPKSIYSEIVNAATCGNVTVLFEDRALYNSKETFKKNDFKNYLNEIRIKETTSNKMVISYGQISNLIENSLTDLSVSTYSLTNLSNVDWDTLIKTASNYNEIIVCEDTWENCSFSSEILARLMLGGIKAKTRRLNLPSLPAPTHREYEKQYFIGKEKLEKFISK